MATNAGKTDQPFAAGLAKLRAIARRAAGPKGKPLIAAALLLEGAIKEELSHPGSGRIYKRAGFRGKLHRDAKARLRGKEGPLRKRAATQLHQASAPGEPPSPDTGALRASIGFEATDTGLRVGSSLAEIAPALEFGTVIATTKGFKRLSLVEHAVRTGSRRVVILPRPFMRPALARVRGQMGAAIVGELRAETASERSSS